MTGETKRKRRGGPPGAGPPHRTAAAGKKRKRPSPPGVTGGNGAAAHGARAPSRKRAAQGKRPGGGGQAPALRVIEGGGAGGGAQRVSRAQGKRRKRRHGRMTLNYILFGILGSALFVVLCYTVFFKVYRIQPAGDLGRYTEEEIIEASGVHMKESLFAVNQKEVYANMTRELPYVDVVQVQKKFPTTVVLNVSVASPAGAIQAPDGYLYISREGKILERGLADYDRSVPLVTGIEPKESDVYVLSQTSEQLVMMKEVFAAVEESGLENINIISLSNYKYNVRMVVENRLLVELGTTNDLTYKLQYVRTTLDTKMDKSFRGVYDVKLLQETNLAYAWEEKDIMSLLEEEEQLEAQEERAKIQVDPDTGRIIVGPHNADGGSASRVDASSASSGASSSSGAAPSVSASAPASASQDNGPVQSAQDAAPGGAASQPGSSAAAPDKTPAADSSSSDPTRIAVGPGKRKGASSSSAAPESSSSSGTEEANL